LKLANLKEHTKEHRENLVTERQAAAGKRAKKANKASETELVTSLDGLKLKLRGFQQGTKVNKKKSMDFLKLQFYKRAQLEAEGKRSYSSIGDQYRSTSKPKKLKLSPPDGSPKTRELPYLSELLELMVKVDVAEKYEDDEVEDVTAVRELPMVCENSMSQRALDAIAELKAEQGKLAAEQEDPVLVELEELYLGKIFRDEDVRGKPHYEVVAIYYDEKSGGKHWEAAVAPAFLSENGVWETPIIKRAALWRGGGR
jgi:hypothetical protein